MNSSSQLLDEAIIMQPPRLREKPYLRIKWNSTLASLWVACTIGFLACAILVANNLRDIHGDVDSGKRTLATRLGAGAVAALARGESSVLVGMIRSRVMTTPYSEIVGIQKPIDPELFELAKVLDK